MKDRIEDLQDLIDSLDDQINQYFEEVEEGIREEDYGYIQDLLSDIEYYQDRLANWRKSQCK